MKAVLITGSTQGIGLGIARHYGARGFHVCLNYVRNEAIATKALRMFEEQGVSVSLNAVAPGAIRTGIWEKAGQSEEMWADFENRSPVGRVATPTDVAEAVWFLAEDPRRFINGTTINVDGGSQWV